MMTVHARPRQTDEWTDGQTDDGQTERTQRALKHNRRQDFKLLRRSE